jgi:hypothetical protein
MKLIASLFFLLCVLTVMSAQTWEKRELSGVKFEFPTPNQMINTPGAFGISYNGDNLFLTVTSLPDTTEFRPTTQLARSRYYAATAASVMFRLRGKMVDAKDTMIEDTHLYYSAIEVLMPDSVVSKYELLQYLYRDTLHGFSCQYIVTDKEGIKVRNRFYNSIYFSEKGGISRLFALVVGSVLLAGVVVFLLFKRRSGKRA